MSISDYSTTPGSNTSIGGINIAEGCSPAGLNNAIRQLMADIAAAAIEGIIPRGVICAWSGSIATVPSGWALCDGTNGTPDWRDRFIVGAGSSYGVGATGGANTVALSAEQMPSHQHFLNLNTNASGDHTHGIRSNFSTTAPSQPRNTQFGLLNDDGGVGAPGATNAGGNHAHNVQGNTDFRGGNQAHENRPPYYAAAFIMKL